MWLNYLLSTKNHATPFRSSFMCDYSFRFISCILYSILFYYIIHTCMQCSSAFINYLGWRTFARVIYILYMCVYVCMCEPNHIFNRWRWRWHIIFDIMAVLCFYFTNGWINTKHGSIICGTIFCVIIRLLRLYNLPALLFGCFNEIWFTNEIKSNNKSNEQRQLL